MIKAILFDLDNTLLYLQPPPHGYAAAFDASLNEYFQTTWGQQFATQIIRTAVLALCEKQTPQDSNSSFILSRIVNTVNRTLDELRADFAAYFETLYPYLQRCTQPIPVMAELVDELLSGGDYAVVIAADPIVNLSSVLQRLKWAGLPAEPKRYALITHSDNMHFSKPQPAYFAEILARIGVEPDEALMVGDSLEADIHPAAQIGLHTFHISTEPENSQRSPQTLRAWMSGENWRTSLPAHPLSPAMIEPELIGNVGALFGMLDNVQPHFWNQHPDPEEWSILQIVSHLLESERMVQYPRLKRILHEDNPFLAQPKPPPGPREMICEAHGYEIARQFADLRMETVRWLRTLAPQDWHRPARHSIFGPTTLLEMAHFTAQHDRLHLTQFCRTLGNCTE